jgi:hypothetical protein
VNPNLRVNRAELIGVWEAETPVYQPGSMGISYDNLDIYTLHFTEDACHFLRWSDHIDKRFPQPDSQYRFFVGTAPSWSVSGNLLTFAENPYLYFNWNRDWVLPGLLSVTEFPQRFPLENNIDSVFSQIGNLRYSSYKAQSLDTFRLWSAKITPESTPVIDTTGDTIAFSTNWLVLGSPFEFRIISKGKEKDESNRESEAIRLVDRECFDRLITLAGVDTLCNVKVFFKRDRPAFPQIVANAQPMIFEVYTEGAFQDKPEYFENPLEIQPHEVPFSYLLNRHHFTQPEPAEE